MQHKARRNKVFSPSPSKIGTGLRTEKKERPTIDILGDDAAVQKERINISTQ